MKNVEKKAVRTKWLEFELTRAASFFLLVACPLTTRASMKARARPTIIALDDGVILLPPAEVLSPKSVLRNPPALCLDKNKANNTGHTWRVEQFANNIVELKLL